MNITTRKIDACACAALKKWCLCTAPEGDTAHGIELNDAQVRLVRDALGSLKTTLYDRADAHEINGLENLANRLRAKGEAAQSLFDFMTIELTVR